MSQVLEDARKLAHGTYDDVIVVEHRKHASMATGSTPARSERGGSGLHVVLEMPEGSRVIDSAQEYEIDGVLGDRAPTVGASYRLIVAPSPKQASHGDAIPGSTLRYETMTR